MSHPRPLTRALGLTALTAALLGLAAPAHAGAHVRKLPPAADPTARALAVPK